jgi:hypothetical protein
MSSTIRVPKAYVKYAQTALHNLWGSFLDKMQTPPMSRDMVAEMVLASVAQMVAEDGDPSTWTDCSHCEADGWYFKNPSDTHPSGICFQCRGKGQQSAADRRRNWGYQKRQEETDARIKAEEQRIGPPTSRWAKRYT